MTNRTRRALAGIGAFVDDLLPMPPDQQAERDFAPGERSDKVAHRRLLRLKLHMLEKRGKGGYR